MQTWFDVADSRAVAASFTECLPLGWTAPACDANSGQILWKQGLTQGFSLELTVHPVLLKGAAFLFQTMLYVTHENYAELENDPRLRMCLPSAGVNDRGIMLSVYLEGLERIRVGGRIDLFTWDCERGISKKNGWQGLVIEAAERFGRIICGPASLPNLIFELDSLCASADPNPLLLYSNPHVLAAKASMLLQDRSAALTYLKNGRETDWEWKSQGWTPFRAEFLALVQCQAKQLHCMLVGE